MGPATNTPIKSRTILETRPGAVAHTDVVEMNDTLVAGARHFVTFIDEASGHLGAFHMKTEGQATELIERHIGARNGKRTA